MDPILVTSAAVLAASDLSLAQVATQALDASGAAGGMDFSLMALFTRATVTVQIVMAVLIAASIWSWAIIIEKGLAYSRLRRASAKFEDDFWSGRPLDEVHESMTGKGTPMERVFDAGMREWNRSFSNRGELIPGTEQRIDRAMNVAIARESEKLNSRLPFLATVGSVAPFVGLFGTVWGIKHAFEEIAIQQNTNLAVVAPGIAEALLATALGLLAAIPAVVAYNRLAADAERLAGGLENFADEFSTILARQIGKQHDKAA